MTVNQNVLTSTIEAWKCDGFKLNLNQPMKTLQLDIMKRAEVTFNKKDSMNVRKSFSSSWDPPVLCTPFFLAVNSLAEC